MVVYECGEKPGKGSYKCRICGKILVLDDETDVLPPCSNPRCNKKCEFTKV